MFIKFYFKKIVESDTFVMKRKYYIKKALHFQIQCFETSVFQI